jgi:hypothetical protein
MPVFRIRNREKMVSALFSFIPKTGGTALIEFFRRSGFEVYFHDENNPIVGLLKVPTQHFHYELLDAAFDIGNFTHSFTVVRNPLDRIRSEYVWCHRDRIGREALPSFDEWVLRVFARYAENAYVLDNHIRPQHMFAGLKIAKTYRYEDGLESVFTDVCESCGIVVDRGSLAADAKFIGRVNTSDGYLGSGRTSAGIPVDDDTRERIRRFYAEDYARFYPGAA